MSDFAHPPLIILGNPENRRVVLFCQAAQRLGLPSPRVVSYAEVLSELLAEPSGSLALAARVPLEALVRIESPGENLQVESALILLGAAKEDLSADETAATVTAAAEHGRIAAPRLWFAGYRRLLGQIEQALAPRGVRWMNHPADIPLLFDKTACQQVLAARGIPTPPPLADADGQMPTNYDSLRRHMAAAAWQRVFVKLRYGSSASGVVALECASRGVQATTSVELVRDGGQVKLFNSLRVRRHTSERDVAAIIDELARHELHVERWLPKAGFQGRVCDLRVVVIGGRVRHCVLRTSRGPLTNLHLGNRRGDAAAFLRILPLDQQQQAWESCASVAQAFPRSQYFGIDLLLAPRLDRHAILEVNAFGDLLPGVLDGGEDTYTAELRVAAMGDTGSDIAARGVALASASG